MTTCVSVPVTEPTATIIQTDIDNNAEASLQLYTSKLVGEQLDYHTTMNESIGSFTIRYGAIFGEFNDFCSKQRDKDRLAMFNTNNV
jgi:hypothetical protein